MQDKGCPEILKWDVISYVVTDTTWNEVSKFL